jgi:3-phenylpropionate/cinnamic acid dioxygenase small subunit
MDAATIAADLEIRRLVAEYCHAVDDGDFDGLLSLFAAEATFRFGDRSYEGEARIRRFFEATQQPEQRGKHLTTNVVVRVEGERAEVGSDFVFVRIVDGVLRPLLTGRYADDVARLGGRWVFERREATVLGSLRG